MESNKPRNERKGETMNATQLTQQQAEAFARFIAEWCYNNEEEWADHLDAFDTTLDPFSRYTDNGPATWREASEPQRDDTFGYPAVYYERVQANKGQERVQLCVMDFGDVRGVYQI